jgi:hypothetical protein
VRREFWPVWISKKTSSSLRAKREGLAEIRNAVLDRTEPCGPACNWCSDEAMADYIDDAFYDFEVHEGFSEILDTMGQPLTVKLSEAA